MISPTYQELKSDYENARIIDYRDPTNPNNKVIITCEHAFNVLPEEYTWTENDKRHFVDEHWGYDIGAYNMANALASELKCVFVHTLYSRLLVDANRSIVSDTLFRRSGDGKEVDLNKDLTYEEEQSRIKKYFVPYYEALREISNKVDFKYAISVHSFTPLYQGETRALEIGVLYGHDSEDFALKLNEGMLEKGYKSEANKPYDGITTMGTVKALIFAKFPSERQGMTFEFRNDILSDEKKFKELQGKTLDVVRETCKLE